MILTCPKCATSYTVDASKIPPEGRTVKCASCGHRWSAQAVSLAVDGDDVFAASVATPAPPVDDIIAVEAPAPETTDLSEAEGPEIPKVYRAKKADERKVRQAAATGIIWAGMAAALVVILAMAAVFRINVVNLWPKSAAAYAWVGLPVNSLGLTIEGVQAKPSLQDGHAALSVSGVLRNVKDKAIEAPPLRVSLLNKAGKSVATKIAQPGDAIVPAGETRHFTIAILDPPLTASQLEVAFAPEAAHKPAHRTAREKAAAAPALRNHAEAPAHGAEAHGSEAHAPEAHAPEAHAPEAHGAEVHAPAGHAPAGPAPVEVKPLPESSPYALNPHG
jgi:predicted Zn finger-like uncharacterized protein